MMNHVSYYSGKDALAKVPGTTVINNSVLKNLYAWIKKESTAERASKGFGPIDTASLNAGEKMIPSGSTSQLKDMIDIVDAWTSGLKDSASVKTAADTWPAFVGLVDQYLKAQSGGLPSPPPPPPPNFFAEYTTQIIVGALLSSGLLYYYFSTRD